MSKFVKNIPLYKFLVGNQRYKSKSGQCKPKPKKPKKQPPPPPSEASTYRLVAVGAILACCGVGGFVFSHLEKEERPPFVPYTYLRLRNKRFPWGDGERSLFHNRDKNPLPLGYEDDLERAAEEQAEKERLEEEKKNKKKKAPPPPPAGAPPGDAPPAAAGPVKNPNVTQAKNTFDAPKK